MRLIALLLVLLIGTTGPLAAQQPEPNREDIIRLLGRMDEFVPVEQQFRSMGFEGENLALALAQYRRVFADRQIAEYMADRLIAAGTGRIPPAFVAGGLIGPLVERGIGHLPTRELVYFFKVENTVFNALPLRECGLAVKQRLSDRRLAEASARAAARLNTPALKEYYRIQYKAARLGLTRDAVRLSTEDALRIEERIGAAIFARTDEAEALSLIRTFDNPARASNRAACAAGRHVMDAVMGLEGRDLRMALIYFSTP